MTELDLYKWVKEWEPEWRWDTNSDTKKADVIIWVSIYSIESFYKLFDYQDFDEGGIEARLVDRSIAIWASDICEPSDIEIEKIFPKE